jgi:hypothetical protein
VKASTRFDRGVDRTAGVRYAARAHAPVAITRTAVRALPLMCFI